MTGLVAQTGRRTVCGMLLGAGAAEHIAHDRAHRFFSHASWSIDQLGLTLARLIVARLVASGDSLCLAVDGTLFRRRGKRVHHAFWTHDGSQPGHVSARGNRWVILGLVVRLPMCTRPVCLPVLLRLWAGKGSPSPVELARTMIGLLARAFPDHTLHVSADAAYHGRPLRDLPTRVTITTRLPRNAVLFHPAPPRTGRRGRPRTKGGRIGTPEQATAHTTWRQATVTCYGRTTTVHTAVLACLWYGTFGTRTGRLILVRDTGRSTLLALFTTDTDTPIEHIIARYAGRWSIEVAIETAKGPMGVGQARNRLALAVHRTVPFSKIVMSLVIVWYAAAGHHPDDVTDRRTRQPWYTQKTEPSFEDMIAKLRRTIIAARFREVVSFTPAASPSTPQAFLVASLLLPAVLAEDGVSPRRHRR
ncbi:MAG TPA: transposase [Rugosimonospora sp.]|nr:transposase [Rugosimonospora sp.]